MRLTPEQIDTIRRVIHAEMGADTTVRLFGSRLDDTARGGDIDLLLQIPHPVENPALISARIAAKLIRAMGGRYVEVVLAVPHLRNLQIHLTAWD